MYSQVIKTDCVISSQVISHELSLCVSVCVCVRARACVFFQLTCHLLKQLSL
jgi:hypothetical protein